MIEGFDLDNFADPVEFALGMHQHENLTSIAVHAELVTRLLFKTPELSPERLTNAIKAKLDKLDYKKRGQF